MHTRTGPFFLGDRPFYCDFGVYHVLSNARLVDPTSLNSHANILAFMSAFEAVPAIRRCVLWHCEDRGGTGMARQRARQLLLADAVRRKSRNTECTLRAQRSGCGEAVVSPACH